RAVRHGQGQSAAARGDAAAAAGRGAPAGGKAQAEEEAAGQAESAPAATEGSVGSDGPAHGIDRAAGAVLILATAHAAGVRLALVAAAPRRAPALDWLRRGRFDNPRLVSLGCVDALALTMSITGARPCTSPSRSSAGPMWASRRCSTA